MIGRAFLAILAAAACVGGDGPTEPLEVTGSMSFFYSGAESGSFNVTGSAGPNQDGTAAMKFDGPPTLLLIAGMRMRSATHGDLLELILPDVTAPRTFSLDEECSTLAACPLAFFGRDVPVQFASPESDADDGFFVFTSGSVTVTSVSATRIAGTFKGSAETLTFEGAPRVITVTNGKFDIPITSLQQDF